MLYGDKQGCYLTQKRDKKDCLAFMLCRGIWQDTQLSGCRNYKQIVPSKEFVEINKCISLNITCYEKELYGFGPGFVGENYNFINDQGEVILYSITGNLDD